MKPHQSHCVESSPLPLPPALRVPFREIIQSELDNLPPNLDDAGRISPKSISFSSSASSFNSENSPPPSPLHRSEKRKTGFQFNPQPLLSFTKQRSEERTEKRRISNDFIELKNPSGHQYSFEQNQLLLTQIHGLIKNKEMDETKAINYLSSISGADIKTLNSLYYEYKNNRIIHSPDTSNMGSANPLHPFYQHEWSLEIELQIHHKIEEYNQTKGFCNTNDIQKFLFYNFNINISRNGLARRLHSLGYKWGRSRTIGGMSLAARIARGVTYMKELSLAIEEENSNHSVIIYSDESYVNVRLKIQYTWFSPYSLTKNEVGGPTGKGDREIIIHSISKDGLLGGDISNNPDLSKEEKSCQHFFVGGYIGEDYHKNMDNEMYINYIKNRLIPTFKSIYPNKKCILILDNANYHHAIGDDYMKLGGTKEQLISKLKKLKLNSIKVNRNGRSVTFTQSTWPGRGGSSSPTVKELNEALKEELPKHKEFQITEIQKLFDQEGWQLLYTPPYTPEVQPIEKVWAYVKHIVASQFTPDRTASSLHVAIIMAFYGKPTLNLSGVTPELCQSLIYHAYRWCDQFINDHIYPGGNLSSLATYLRDHPEQEAVADDNQDINDGVAEEEQDNTYDIFDFIGDEEDI